MLQAMHIPDGFLDPGVALVTVILAAMALGYSLRRLRLEAGERVVPLVGVTAAGIFAAQMVNFPLGVVPASGHLTGGVLAAVLLGPWAGALAMTCVLLIQCLLFGDGGITALGANILNMAVIGPLVGYAIYNLLRRWLAQPGGRVVSAMIAAWLVVPLAAVAFAAELAAGGNFHFLPVATLMLFFHLLIGIGEALITGLVVAWVVKTRPAMLYEPGHVRPVVRGIQFVTAGLAMAIAIVILLAPWASELDDGLEAAAARLNLGAASAVAENRVSVPFPDYGWPNEDAVSSVAGPIWRHARFVTAVTGLIGTIATCGASLILARSVQAPRRAVGTAHDG